MTKKQKKAAAKAAKQAAKQANKKGKGAVTDFGAPMADTTMEPFDFETDAAVI
jgi:hypothetical protein|eukprot:SAG25_NODE_42_length_19413_cov_107.539609_6_plen_53_part_00